MGKYEVVTTTLESLFEKVRKEIQTRSLTFEEFAKIALILGSDWQNSEPAPPMGFPPRSIDNPLEHLSTLQIARKHLDEWFIAYYTIVFELEKGVTPYDIAEIFIDLLQKDTVMTSNGHLVRTTVSIDGYEGREKKELPSVSELSESFSMDKTVEETLDVLATIIELIVEHRYPFAHKYLAIMLEVIKEKP